MTNNLILDVKPHQLTAYGKLLVAFYDNVNEKRNETNLYIHLQNADDRYLIIKRKAQKRRAPNGEMVDEIKLFARAYDKYLQLKNVAGDLGKKTAENEALKAKVAQLEAKVAKEEKEAKEEVKEEKKEEKKEEVKVEKSAKDLKEELDSLGVEYKGNASKEALQELLAQNK